MTLCNGTGNHHAGGHTIEPGASGPLSAALACQAAGLSVIPIRRDGSKAAVCRWEPYQHQAATEAQVRRWFAGDTPPGLAVIGGEVSGGLECLDFDAEAEAVFAAWCELVEVEAPGLVARLCVARTPKPGFHVRYRVPDIQVPGNTKLATDPAAGCLIETRGEGGYALAPGCPVECHASGRPYAHHSGPPLERVQAIGIEEREVLIRCARSFDRAARKEAQHASNGTGAGLRPGTDFNERGPDWSEILDGWTVAHRRGEARYWRRPGKEGPGWSATTGVCRNDAGQELLYVFTSNAAPFEPGACYSRFAAYAFIRHRGDFKAAAKELAADGYGDHPTSATGSVEAKTLGRRPAAAILGEHLHAIYAPSCRRGDRIWSTAMQAEVRRSEALARVADSALIARLVAEAQEMPRGDQGEPKRAAAPKVCRDWAPTAWADLLAGLEDESNAEELDATAEADFQRRLSAALTKLVPLALKGKGADRESERELRSVLHWCLMFAKAGRWAQIRSYYVWCRLDGPPAEQDTADRHAALRVAVRPELFGPGQLGLRDLADMGQDRLADLCERYQLGRRCRAGRGGNHAIELEPDFLRGLLESPEPADGDGVTGGSRAHARENSVTMSPGEQPYA
jgi:putative DNA primase/helicase